MMAGRRRLVMRRTAGPAVERGGAVAYGYIGSMKAQPGHRDDVVSLLLNGVDGLREAGCQLCACRAQSAIFPSGGTDCCVPFSCGP